MARRPLRIYEIKQLIVCAAVCFNTSYICMNNNNYGYHDKASTGKTLPHK